MASDDSNQALPQREPYNGLHRRLIIAFDIGTTFSGVSYTILDHGQRPQRKLPALPTNKTATQVFSDLLEYLYQSTQEYIQERHGTSFWSTLIGNIDFIVGHPNGWEGEQQAVMRNAVLAAGLVHIFISASEALCKAMSHHGIMVIDCGGGTIDISTYTRVSNSSLKENGPPPQCLLQGSVLVTQRAQEHLSQTVKGSDYGNPTDIKNMTDYFDRVTKLAYTGSHKTHFVKFGKGSDKDDRYGIIRGSIKMSGTEIEAFFEPSIREIVRVVSEQTRCMNVNISVGDYLS
ncbi:hypothetical protein AMATHDRAFT_5372 [Amanita thiersii Skay4041]|uniref:Uncharacterized protein n=1 Tax=Amanita thiersii Skay4041 TaxID=703135 RepID=A0A2A9NKQ7_9AGAR|nr:hypothetical protein AMATHDRAFT_5372 [Amanita thiersii Skay4041]